MPQKSEIFILQKSWICITMAFIFIIIKIIEVNAACISPADSISIRAPFLIFDGKIGKGAHNKIVASHSSIFVSIKNESSSSAIIGSLYVWEKDAQQFSCASSPHGLRPGSSIILDVPAYYEYNNLHIMLSGDANVSIYSDVYTSYQTNINSVITRPIYILLFYNHPHARRARDDVQEALNIWRKVGINFKPIYKKIGERETIEILGQNKIMPTIGNFRLVPPDELVVLENITSLKKNIDLFSVVYAKTESDSPLLTRTDPVRKNVYISGPCGESFANTIAHEIGHLLLGGGHTGSPESEHTSSLMNACPNLGSEISKMDADRARRVALNLPLH